ncbi:MAG: serine/threonine-protein kinase [candidate division Zixibacteria bacterium]
MENWFILLSVIASSITIYTVLSGRLRKWYYRFFSGDGQLPPIPIVIHHHDIFATLDPIEASVATLQCIEFTPGVDSLSYLQLYPLGTNEHVELKSVRMFEGSGKNRRDLDFDHEYPERSESPDYPGPVIGCRTKPLKKGKVYSVEFECLNTGFLYSEHANSGSSAQFTYRLPFYCAYRSVQFSATLVVRSKHIKVVVPPTLEHDQEQNTRRLEGTLDATPETKYIYRIALSKTPSGCFQLKITLSSDSIRVKFDDFFEKKNKKRPAKQKKKSKKIRRLQEPGSEEEQERKPRKKSHKLQLLEGKEKPAQNQNNSSSKRQKSGGRRKKKERKKKDLDQTDSIGASSPTVIDKGFTIGKYVISEKLYHGDLCNVYRAKDSLLKRDVILKLLHEEYVDNHGSRNRLMNEARLVSKLRHPNVVTLYDYYFGSHPYLILEFITGKTVREMLKNIGGRIELRESLRIAIEVCHGLEAAHSMEIIHRDIKPSNVIVSEPDGGVCVLDFGLAIAKESVSKEKLRFAGTPLYMSPEQTEGSILDNRSDIFSLGVMLYEMLTGNQIFAKESREETIEAICEESPSFDLTAAVPEHISERLIDVLRKATEKDPKDRFHQIADMRHKLKEIAKLALRRGDAPEY